MTADANLLTSRATSRIQEGPPTPVSQFRAWIDALERLGYDPGRLLEGSGLSRGDLEDPDVLVPCSTCGTMLARAQQIRPLRNMWARLAIETPITAFPLVDYLVHTSDDVGDAVRQLARYLPLVPAPLTLDIRDDEDPVRVICVMEAWAQPASAEYTVALNSRRFREETDDRVRFAYASFTHQPDDVADLEALLGCPVRPRASWAGMALSREAWRTPLLRRDPILRRVLEGQAEAMSPGQPTPGGIALEVRRALVARLPRAETEIETIARDLRMSTRTLQRRLSSAGLSYQELLDRARRENAEKCIANSLLSISEVAYLVGYSEPAAFHRAFRRWTGLTPQAFRQRARSI
jgi:AraC-like DNA-binding protein